MNIEDGAVKRYFTSFPFIALKVFILKSIFYEYLEGFYDMYFKTYAIM